MSDMRAFEMAIPLDSGGFLRRECPTCEREFKWLPTPGEGQNADPVQDGGYFCPYCGVQAPVSAWLTQAQVALAQNIVAMKVIGPMASKLGAYRGPKELDPLTEIDDMTRIDFPCHPAEPLKVQDGWRKALRCLICGTPLA